MKTMFLWASLALVPGAALLVGAAPTGCPECPCCGCCDAGVCRCKKCACECCVTGCDRAAVQTACSACKG